jgi:hypothetical protein
VLGALPGESKRLVVESPWSQFTSECQRFGHPPRLDEWPPFWLQLPIVLLLNAALFLSSNSSIGASVAVVVELGPGQRIELKQSDGRWAGLTDDDSMVVWVCRCISSVAGPAGSAPTTV